MADSPPLCIVDANILTDLTGFRGSLWGKGH